MVVVVTLLLATDIQIITLIMPNCKKSARLRIHCIPELFYKRGESGIADGYDHLLYRVTANNADTYPAKFKVDLIRCST